MKIDEFIKKVNEIAYVKRRNIYGNLAIIY